MLPVMVREHSLLSSFSILYLCGFTAVGLADGNLEAVVYFVAVGLAFMFMTYARARVEFSSGVLWGLSLWGLAHMAGGLVHVNERVLYSVQLIPVVLRYDQAVHAFGFGFATLAAWQGLSAWLIPERKMTGGLALLVALCGMGVGAFNEVLEFFLTRVAADTNVGGYENTGWDLVFNTLGAVAAAGWVFSRRSRSPGGKPRTHVL
jgi:hypothetical protein